MNWSEEFLYNKSKLFMSRSIKEQAKSELSPFWAALSLELLCRASLAKKHPILLADPKDINNLLYACGESVDKSPQSISMKEVIVRCQNYVPLFDEECSKTANKMMGLRNTELHSGEAAFNSLVQSSWQPNFYILVDVILKHLGRTIEDYLGTEVAGRAKHMLQERDAKTKKDVLSRINKCKNWFEQLDQKSSQEKQVHAESKVKEILEHSLTKECKCPACESPALIIGQVTDSGEPKLIDGEIVIEKHVLPKGFRCFVCDLRLTNFAEIDIANLGAVYTISETEDPIEYFGIIPEEHVDIDKMIQEQYEYQDE